VGDHILEDANIDQITGKLGKKKAVEKTTKKVEVNEEMANEVKDTVLKFKKKIKELEDYSVNLQKDLSETQEKLMSEMEEKNKYLKQANTLVVEKEELKQANSQLQLKVNTLEKTVDSLSKKIKYYEDQLNGAMMVQQKKEDAKKETKKQDDLRKVLDLGSSSEEPLQKNIPKQQAVKPKTKELGKKPTAVQVTLSSNKS